MKTIHLSTLTAVIAFSLFHDAGFAQVPQTSIYIWDGSGNMTTLTAPSGPGTIIFPSGGGTLLTTSNAGTISSGTWHATPIGLAYGGTGATNATGIAQNAFFAGPSTGGSGAASFRSIAATDMPVFVASGGSHASGAVPDPGASAGTTRFLREDATWATPSGGSTAGARFVGGVQVLGSSAISTTATCLGAGGSFTPAKTGTVLVIISGTLSQGNSFNPASTLTPFAGTGSDPGYGTSFTPAFSGTQIIYPASAAGSVTFEASSVITGLTVGTSYYIDVSLKSSSSGQQVTPSYIQMTAIEF